MSAGVSLLLHRRRGELDCCSAAGCLVVNRLQIVGILHVQSNHRVVRTLVEHSEDVCDHQRAGDSADEGGANGDSRDIEDAAACASSAFPAATCRVISAW